LQEARPAVNVAAFVGHGALHAAVKGAAKRNGLYATHVRNRDVYYDLGFTEATATARHAGARRQISHIQPKFGAPPHAMEHTLELFYRAEREGVDVAFDVIPHDWSHTSMVAVLLMWAREGGTAKTLERLRDPALRERMKHNPQPIWRLGTARRWEEIVLLRSVCNPDLQSHLGHRRRIKYAGSDPTN
jgi:N-acyl-D-amino-acid deacylase